jgi:hypothetical protein
VHGTEEHVAANEPVSNPKKYMEQSNVFASWRASISCYCSGLKHDKYIVCVTVSVFLHQTKHKNAVHRSTCGVTVSVFLHQTKHKNAVHRSTCNSTCTHYPDKNIWLFFGRLFCRLKGLNFYPIHYLTMYQSLKWLSIINSLKRIYRKSLFFWKGLKS